MPRFFCVCSLLLVACITVSNASSLDHRWLDNSAYPVALTALKEGKLIEISSADSQIQIAEDDNGNRIDFSATRMQLAKGSRFAEGEIRVASSRAVVLEDTSRAGFIASSFTSPEPEGMLVEASLSPSRSYSNVVMAAVFFTNEGVYEVSAQSIGDLVAGQSRRIALRSPVVYDYVNHDINYTLLFFSEEGEIVSDIRRRATPLVNRMFEDFYGNVIASFQTVNELSDRPVSVVHRYPINFEGLEKLTSKQRGKTYFTLSIDEMGLVKSVKTDAKLNAKLLARCERSLKEWLFLPRIQDGFPVAASARVPVYWD